MKYISGIATDVGIKKSTNQDSALLRIGRTENEELALIVLCDGMGGLSKGELASAEVVRAFSNWFDEKLADALQSQSGFDKIIEEWKEILYYQNEKLYNYGKDNGVNLGTTISAVLLINNAYAIVNVGDSRVYRLSDKLEQITEDQSLVAREVKLGRLTPEEASVDPRRNVLLQCVGATADLEINTYTGELKMGEAMLLCSDGFRHMITPEEIYNEISPEKVLNDIVATSKLETLIKVNKERQETDNITAVYIKLGE